MAEREQLQTRAPRRRHATSPAKSHPIVYLLAWVVATTLLAAGCAKSAAQSPPESPSTAVTATPPVDGGSLRIGLVAETNSYSPVAGQWANEGYMVGRAIYDPLMAMTADGALRPYLAESVEAVDGYYRFLIKLRAGVVFHDGTPLTADVVKQNLEAQRKGIVAGQMMAPVTEINATGPLTLEVKMKEPWSTFAGYLAIQIGFIAAPSTLASPDNAPVGTGPFQYVSWTRDSQMKLRKNPNYWQKGLPHVDELEYRVLPDTLSRNAALNAGDIDIDELTTSGQLKEFAAVAQRHEMQFFADPAVEMPQIVIGLNTTREPFNDLNARRAVAAAIDTQRLSQDGYDGVYPASSGPVPAESPWHASSAYPRFDTNAARQFASDYANAHGGQPLSFILKATPDPARAMGAQIIQEMMKDAGIDMQITKVEQATIVTNALFGDYQATMWINLGDPSMESQNIFLNGANVRPNGQLSLAWPRLADDKIDEGYRLLRTTHDGPERVGASQAIQRRLGEQLPFVYLVQMKAAVAANNRVHGIETATMPDGVVSGLRGGLLWPQHLWVDKG